ncbi:Fmp25p Ecym_1535 [Eremothecium cymbalariae DBVPG|uniref:Protein FMP25, mitochondrial n=1 Tax=Eremothecium cymbalariae (strain CBS 270.75 / DBVPG 7215 / KCTC 17166 / NRRL Y-17582) TaxID=931890 RepID=G8JMU0_ERECY|nr:hypothetical protein Ecym_1535 [Eremothecium cymbalariae DBVPG\
MFIAYLRVPRLISRRVFSTSHLCRVKPQYDDAEILAEQVNHSVYKAKRTRMDYNWNAKSQAEVEKEHEDRIEKMQKLSAIFQGMLFLFGIGTVGTLYLQWPQVKGWWLAKDIRVDDDTIERLIRFKRKKAILAIPSLPIDQPTSDVPGLYYWGSRLGDGNSNFPVRVPWFDNKHLRSIALAESGLNLAIDEKGDLYRWDTNSCELYLPDQNLLEVHISNGAAYALNKQGEILIVPLSDEKLLKRHISWHRSFVKPWRKYCFYDWKLDTASVFKSRTESRIEQFSVGIEHLIFLSNGGKAYACATGIKTKKSGVSKGQFGVPELSRFDTFPECNKAFEIELLNSTVTDDGKLCSRTIEQIACGSYHTLARDSDGHIYSFGINTHGQLGLPISYDSEYVPFPKMVGNFRAHFPQNQFKCVDIHCCGDTSFVGIVPQTVADNYVQNQNGNIGPGYENATYFSFGNGIQGQLGNGHFKHSLHEPTKMKVINDTNGDQAQQSKGSHVTEWYCGERHIMCKLENGELLAWGCNENGQLGNGKRVRWARPGNIPKLLEPRVDYTEEPSKTLFNPENKLILSKNQQIALGPNSSCLYWKIDK